jgi:hypothetical protein
LSVSAGELLGVAMLVGLATGVCAAAIVPSLCWRLRRKALYQDRRRAVCSRWLDARCAMTRASKDYIMAFRAVDPRHHNEPDDPASRRAEAARQTWLRASSEWSSATAQLMVWWNQPDLGATIRRLEQPDDQSIRAAVGRSGADVEALFVRLDALDASVIHAVRHMLREPASWWRRCLVQVVAFVGGIADHWSRPG